MPVTAEEAVPPGFITVTLASPDCGRAVPLQREDPGFFGVLFTTGTEILVPNPSQTADHLVTRLRTGNPAITNPGIQFIET